MILALDLGTNCGWAWSHEGVTESGTWYLGTGPQRWANFRALLHEALGSAHCELVVFEEVISIRNHLSARAAHVYGGLKALMELGCHENKVPCHGIQPSVIKKRATGRGNAKKEQMVAAAKRRWWNVDIIDDNQADALWILECALH